MIQVAPDWTATYSPEQAEQQLRGFKFRGPGFYLSPTEFLLVTPLPPNHQHQDGTDSVWHQTQPEGTIFQFHYYGVPLNRSIFGVRTPPTREDSE